MFVDSSKYSGRCSCGRDHEMITRAAVIEPGCLRDFEKWLERYEISGKRCTLYGENSYAATEGLHPAAEQEIILRSEGLHANEISTAEVLEKLREDIEIIVAIGSGTIHDIARYCAYDRGIRFVSVPTGASVDGYCSTVAAMTWYGFKKTLTAVAPEIVIADTDIIKKAPFELAKSGVGDIMAKYTALTDWQIAHELCGEYLCPEIFAMMKQAADTVMDSIDGLISGEDKAFEDLTYALVLSGLAMQMMGNSRPASGAEHHISHMIEMEPEAFTVNFPAMHGEKTGVGSIIAAAEYHRLAEIEDISPLVKAYEAVSAEKLTAFFGSRLAPAIIEENSKDCLAALSPERLSQCWQRIREIISSLPSAESFHSALCRLDAKRSLEDIGVSSADTKTLLEYSPLVRNRLTLMRVRRMIKL